MASKDIPEWYKNTNSYSDGLKIPKIDNERGETPSTIKKCMPVFDSICAGYLIKSPSDVYVTDKIDENGNRYKWYEWPNSKLIEFHGNSQAPLHPDVDLSNNAFPKWLNPWGIKTEKGYSSLFIQPMHRDLPFTILPGIVDTDKYYNPVNFPFVLKDSNFKGIIPAGTPIVQVIPIKRDLWEMEIDSTKYKDDLISHANTIKSKFFDGYKTFFRQNKEYK